jgi:hypothetical protein
LKTIEADGRALFLALEPVFDSTSPAAADSLEGAGAERYFILPINFEPGSRWPYCQRLFDFSEGDPAREMRQKAR